MIERYMHWLHTQWPAGRVETLPEVRPDGTTNVPGVIVVGDLTGIPLLKFAGDTGTRAVQRLVADSSFQTSLRDGDSAILDLVIVGAGVSGMAAALEARNHDLRFVICEASQPFSTIVNFPRAKPIFAYPTDMTPAGDLQFKADRKEPLLEELRAQTAGPELQPRQVRVERIERQGKHLRVHLEGAEPLEARRVIVAIGKSGNHRRLNVPGEEREKVYNTLYDPNDYRGRKVLVVGGGDSAVETAIAIAECGGDVTLSYRQSTFSRPKAANLAKLDVLVQNSAPSAGDGRLRLAMQTGLKEIHEETVVLLDAKGSEYSLTNDIVFTMIGREPPLDFFHRSGIRVAGEKSPRFWIGMALILAVFTGIYLWKGYTWGPWAVQGIFDRLGGTIAAWAADPTTLLGTINQSMTDPGFYYTCLYSLLILVFGIRRIRRRRTPYISLQTWTLILIQILPLFLLPYILFPWIGANGAFDAGFGKWFADTFMPDESYWRAFGFILAWPLFVYNIFTAEPLIGWLVLGAIQTFVLIPAMIYFWGKGAYCGWICSCGAMAETLGDTHRHKMPHGPFWNRLNMAGQALLLLAFLLLAWRLLGWLLPAGNPVAATFQPFAIATGWKPVVDILLAGILGFGLYFHFSGRVWCRFFCPLAALMHIYTRFSRFRIFADKKKCISCNQCTAVCHQGIDVMSFANRGAPMNDPQCVRCSACVHVCPTAVLAFGQIDPRTGRERSRERFPASPVRMRESKPPADDA